MTTGAASTRLDYAIEQVWGESLAQGDVAVRVESGRARFTGARDRTDVRDQFWAVPTAAAAQYLVPRSRAAAAASLSDYARLRPFRTRAGRRALAAAAALGLPLSRDVVAVTPATSGVRTVVDELAHTLGLDDVIVGLGVRTGANAKPTLELRTTDGTIVGYAKLGWNAPTTQAVRNEANALRKFGLTARLKAPAVLASGRVAEREYVVVQPLPASVERIAPAWDSLSAAEALGPGAVAGWSAWSGVGQVRQVAARQFGSTVPDDLARALADLIGRVCENNDPTPVAAFWHGDFVPWNLARDADGQLWVFDWETAEADVPAGLDALHWYAHSQGAPDPAKLVTSINRASERVMSALRSLGHSRASAGMLPVWYAAILVSRAAAAADSLGGWERVQLQPSVLSELLRWARARYATIREDV